MWPFILLLGTALGAKAQLNHGEYQLDTDDTGILKHVKLTKASVSKIDLSNLGLRGIDKNAFDDVIGIKSLVLNGNSIEQLPEFVFANLTSLDELSITDNKLSEFENTFVGLSNLKLLNISNNQLRHLRKSYLFGVGKTTDIVVRGNPLWSISTVLFENPFLRDAVDKDDDDDKLNDKGQNGQVEEVSGENLKNTGIHNENGDPVIDESLNVKICIDNGIVKSVEELMKSATLDNDCRRAHIAYKERTLVLSNLGITGFKEGWYKLKNYSFNSIDLTGNKITEIKSELLNDLPRDLAFVNLAMNKITKLSKGTVNNRYLKALNFKDNLISEIEDGALEKTQLSGFFAIGNRLRDLNFARSLPSSLTEMIVSQNQIVEISNDTMVNLKNLVYLNLAQNDIAVLNSGSLNGLSSLQVLILTNNKVKKIQPGAFKDMINLRTLYLYRNSIVSLENGTFVGLENLKDLNLAWNKIRKIDRTSFYGLPETLRDLHLDYNEINELEIESFVNVPKFTLSLDGNKIVRIPRGTFNLPYLHELHLKNNSLVAIDGDAFEGLPRLRRLSLNANKIHKIEKGAAKNMGRIHLLDLSKNPIERLENGALFGLPKSKGSFVYISDMNLKGIQGGIFEDI